MARKYRAMLDGFDLKLQDISDSFKRALVRHAISYRDLPDLEDQGLKDREIRFRCYFYGPSYEKHFDFVDHISRSRTTYTLVHPVYGELKGGAENIDVRHDRRQSTAEVDFTFVQQGQRENIVEMGDIAGLAEGEFEAGVKAQAESVAAGAREALGAEAGDLLGKTLDADRGLLEQFTGITGNARAFVGQLDSAVSALEGTLAEIANPADSLIASLEFTADLPGRVIGSIARAAERYSKLYETMRSAPDRFLRNFRNSMDSLNGGLGLEDTDSGMASGKARMAARALLKDNLTAMGAQVAALELSRIFSEDEALRDRARKLEGGQAFDARGNRTSFGDIPVILSIREIERSLATARQYIQAAVDRNRGIGNLKNQALNLLRHVNEIKLEREKIKTVFVDNSMPLVILCHMNGIPYTYAQRVLSINNGLDPNFVSGEVSIYER